MIFDIVSYFNEIELLRLRLHTLRELVDVFVIVESNVTHSGKKKNYTLERHLDDLKCHYNIIYIKHVGLENPENSWVNENNQRNSATNELDISEGDTVLISDVDEIPSAKFINSVVSSNFKGVHISIQEMSFFWPNLRSSEVPMWMGGTRAIKWMNRNLIDSWRSSYSNSFLEEYNLGFTLTKLRLVNMGRPVLNGGWHLSYYGGPERISKKLSSFAHTELNAEESSLTRIENLMTYHRGFFGNESYSVFGSYLECNDIERVPDKFDRGTLATRLVARLVALKYYGKIYLKYFGKMFV